MNQTKKFVMALLLTGFVLLAVTGTAVAESYYVSTNGANSNSGTSMNTAWEEIEYGSKQLEAGDTLFIGGGTYWNDKVVIERSGTSSNWITVTNYKNEQVLMQHDKEFNNDAAINGLCHKSYIKIGDMDISHYGTVTYISGKYEGNTHHITLENIDIDRTYNRALCANAGAHDITFKDILIMHVEHPDSSPNAVDFLTSPHDEDRNPHSNYIIHNILCDNVDIEYVESHNGFNFGQGCRPEDGDWSSHWDTKMCDNFHFTGCDVSDAAVGYYCNKYVLHNSVIEDCDITGCWNGIGFIGNNLKIENVDARGNEMNGIYAMWDTRSYDVKIICCESYEDKGSKGVEVIKYGDDNKKTTKPEETEKEPEIEPEETDKKEFVIIDRNTGKIIEPEETEKEPEIEPENIRSTSGESYYVSTDGDNGNSGTSMNNAFGTVEYGSGLLGPGDTLYIGGGTYWNDKVVIERSGTSNNWITVTNYNDEKVKMYHDAEFNNMCLIHLVDKRYIEIENIESSHYGSAVYISGKYQGHTHNIIITNVDSLRSYSRGYACNAGAHDITFTDILIQDVQHPTSAPNSFDFLTSPHDKNYEPYDNYMIYNIKLINVDLDYNHNHGGFNFGQGVSVGDYSQHWEGKLCDNIYMEGCDAVDIAGAAFYTNKYVLHNSKIIDCSASGGFTGLGLIGNNLLIENLASYDNNPNGHDLYFLWDEPCNDVTVKCFDGDREPHVPDCSKNEVTIINCGERTEEKEDNANKDPDNWIEEYIGDKSDGGEHVTTKELQHAINHWLEDIPVRGHTLGVEDIQVLYVLWLESPQ